MRLIYPTALLRGQAHRAKRLVAYVAGLRARLLLRSHHFLLIVPTSEIIFFITLWTLLLQVIVSFRGSYHLLLLLFLLRFELRLQEAVQKRTVEASLVQHLDVGWHV